MLEERSWLLNILQQKKLQKKSIDAVLERMLGHTMLKTIENDFGFIVHFNVHP